MQFYKTNKKGLNKRGGNQEKALRLLVFDTQNVRVPQHLNIWTFKNKRFYLFI